MRHPWNIDDLVPVPEMVNRRYDREQVYRWVREAFELIYHDIPNNVGRCVYWTHIGCHILRLCGYRALLQAGSFQWPRCPDKGTNNTHISYLWHGPEPVLQGALPEIHCWIGLPDENQIIDFSTGELPTSANTLGLHWELPHPPPYLWAEPENLPDGVAYIPSMEAIAYMFHRLNRDAAQSTANRKVEFAGAEA